jgi:hypothetical protein
MNRWPRNCTKRRKKTRNGKAKFKTRMVVDETVISQERRQRWEDFQATCHHQISFSWLLVFLVAILSS